MGQMSYKTGSDERHKFQKEYVFDKLIQGQSLVYQSKWIACGLCLGTNLCHPHECNCGEMVESKGRHGLKCKQAGGRK